MRQDFLPYCSSHGWSSAVGLTYRPDSGLDRSDKPCSKSSWQISPMQWVQRVQRFRVQSFPCHSNTFFLMKVQQCMSIKIRPTSQGSSKKVELGEFVSECHYLICEFQNRCLHFNLFKHRNHRNNNNSVLYNFSKSEITILIMLMIITVSDTNIPSMC